MYLKEPLLKQLCSSIMELPTPLSISNLWNLGFLLGMTLLLQIVTGIFLAMNFIPSIDHAFNSVIHIMRDLNSGWIMRYMHMNGASVFFILLYSHLTRGMYFNSPKKMPLVWTSGVIILLTTMMTAFVGYVLPWGQMSFWGATVITSMISALPYIGKETTQWIWGNFSVSEPTLNRFFSLHFLLPMIISVFIILHLMALHKKGSSNPSGTIPDYDKTKFFPYFFMKDILPLSILLISVGTIMSIDPNMLGDVENFNTASSTTTPAHIQPEWYFLFAYAILRAIPSKLGGVMAMGAAILILLLLMFKKNTISSKFSPSKKSKFWMFISISLLLTWIGANPVETPFVMLGQILTTMYFTLVMML